MGEFSIQCTTCSGTFGGEEAYNVHQCSEGEKLEVNIKSEPQDNEDEMDDFLASVPPGEYDCDTINIKNEPFDMVEPIATDEDMESNNRDSDLEDPLSIVVSNNPEESIEENDSPVPGNDHENSTPTPTKKGNRNSKTSTKETIDKKLPFSYTDDLSFKCKLCSSIFSDKEKFTKHFRESHKNYRPYECGVCGKAFLHKHYVNLHMRVHTGEKPYVCQLCPNSYSHKTSFTIHMRIHNGDRPYSCEVCGKKCYDKSGLTSHMRSHTKETPYQCEVCGRRFTHSKSLLVHRRNHTGEKPYVCNYCGKAFRHWHKHKIHVRLHTGERPYKCKVCGKGFPRNDEVSRHMRSHQGIKSFKCSICGVYCATQASITGHINLHHFNLKSEDFEPPPEKTLVKDSTSGILGTKVPEPRSHYRLANKKSTPGNKSPPTSSTLANKLSCRVIEVTSKDTPITIPSSAKKAAAKKIKCILPKPKTSVQTNDKSMSYQEFLNWQERMLTNQGLVVKGYPSTSNKSTTSCTNSTTTTTGSNKFSVKSISQDKTKTPLSSTIPTTSGVSSKPQYLLLSQGGERNGTKILLPLNMIDQSITQAKPGSPPGGSAAAVNLPTLVAPNTPNATPGLQGPRPMFLSVASQPLFFVSNGGQRMLLMASQNSNKQTDLVDKTAKEIPAIKEDPDLMFQPELSIKTEIDDDLSTCDATDSFAFKIKEEPDDV